MEIKKKFQLNMKVFNEFLEKQNITLYKFAKIFDVNIADFYQMIREGFSYNDIKAIADAMNTTIYDIIK